MLLRGFLSALLVGLGLSACRAQPVPPPPRLPLPPRPELPARPGLPPRGPAAPEQPAPPPDNQAARPLPYEPPPPVSAEEKRLRDLVFGLVCAMPLALGGFGLILLTLYKRPYLSGRLYARGLVVGGLLVLAGLFLAVAVLLRLLDVGWEFKDLWA